MNDDTRIRASEAARRLGIRTRDLLRLTYDRAIPYVVIDGVAHYRPSDLDVYRAEHGLPGPAESTVIRGTETTTSPARDALRDELAAEHLRDFQQIVAAEDRALLREVWPLVVLAANEYASLAGHDGFDHLAADIELAVSVRDRIATGELPPW